MLSENAVRSLWTTGSLCNSKYPCMSVNCPWLYVVLSTALPGKSWINWAMAKGVATDFWLAEGGRRCARPDTTYPNVISPISATYLHNMPSKTIFRVLKKEKVTRFPGVVPSELLNWRGRVLSVPPAFDAQGNGVWKGAHGHQRCQFAKTVEVAEAWDLATNFVWGRRNFALSNPRSLKVVSRRILVTLLKNANNFFFPKLLKSDKNDSENYS